MASKRITAGMILAPLLVLCSTDVSADAAKAAQQCAACHGKDGASTESAVPIIGGVPKQYMVDNLNAYKNKERPCPEHKIPSGPKKGQATDMCRVAKELNDADIKAIADYFSAKPFIAAKQTFDAGKAQRGKEVHDRLCEKCHSEGGTEPDDETGRLGGQWKPYLEMTLKQLRKGERAIPKKMKPKIEALNDDDAEALTHFYASQQK